MKILAVCGALLLASLALAQSETSSVTVAVTRTLALPIEQVTFSVQVSSAPDATLDQVLQAVQSLGFTAKDLIGVSSGGSLLPILPGGGVGPIQFGPPGLVWSFSLTAPFSQFQQTLAKLRAAGAPDKKTNFPVSFSIVNASANQSTVDQAANAALPDLIADARARAKGLTDAAGATLGPILEISDNRYGAVGGSIGSSSFFLGNAGGFSTPQLTVSVTVRFVLLRYTSGS